MKESKGKKFVEGFYNGVLITVISIIIGKILSNLYLNKLPGSLQLVLILSSIIIIAILFFFWIIIFKNLYKEINNPTTTFMDIC